MLSDTQYARITAAALQIGWSPGPRRPSPAWRPKSARRRGAILALVRHYALSHGPFIWRDLGLPRTVATGACLALHRSGELLRLAPGVPGRARVPAVWLARANIVAAKQRMPLN